METCLWTGLRLIIITIGFIEVKIDTDPQSPRRDSPGTGMGQYPKSASQGMTKVGVCQSKQVSFELVSGTINSLTVCGSLFHSTLVGGCKATPTFFCAFWGELMKQIAYNHN